MIRFSTIFLCLLLASAAAGRYKAEVSVRDARAEMTRLEREAAQETRAIQVLRAEVAYLENPDRLAKIARSKTDLRPTKQEQSLSARQFASLLGEFDDEEEYFPADNDLITNAIAMAQLAAAECN